MVLSTVLFAFAAAVPAPGPSGQARAVVRIVTPVRATADAWRSLPPERRREVTVRGSDGRPVRVRLIEME